MAERIIPLRSIRNAGRVLTNAYVTSSTARSKSASGFQKVRVGVAKGTGVDWLGEYSGAKHALTANQRFSLTGELDINFPLSPDENIVAGVTTIGSAASLDGMTIEVRGDRVGEVGEVQSDRPDGSFPGAHGISSQLFHVPGDEIDGQNQAMDTLVSNLNDSGVTEWEIVFPLYDAAPTVNAAAAGDDYDAADDTITSTSFADGNVSVAVAIPAGYTKAYVKVDAVCSWDSDTASHSAFGSIAIGDGTTDHNEVRDYSTGNGLDGVLATTFAGELTADTTFTLRLKYTSSGSSATGIVASKQTIAYIATFTKE